MKLEKMVEYLPDGTREILGYKVKGKELYLMKHYTWGNNFSWIINTDGTQHYYEHEFSKAVENKEVILCSSFKDGKQKLEKML